MHMKTQLGSNAKNESMIFTCVLSMLTQLVTISYVVNFQSDRWRQNWHTATAIIHNWSRWNTFPILNWKILRLPSRECRLRLRLNDSSSCTHLRATGRCLSYGITVLPVTGHKWTYPSRECTLDLAVIDVVLVVWVSVIIVRISSCGCFLNFFMFILILT